VFGTARWNFFYWIFALQIRGAAGGTLERKTSPAQKADNLGGTHNTHWFCPARRWRLYGARFSSAQRAGFFPGVIVYLSHWFVYQDRAKAVARFMFGIPIAYILGGPLAGMSCVFIGSTLPDGDGVFLLEGVPAILLGIATLFVLPIRLMKCDGCSLTSGLVSASSR